jgi:hypothetical protein
VTRAWIPIGVFALLAGCTGLTDPSPLPDPSVESTLEAPPDLIPTEALPVPDPSPWPIKPNDQHARPRSAEVAIGRERPFELYTHCGIDFHVDFAGSFWQWYAGKTGAVGDPFQKGTMTLLSDDAAVFRYHSRGDQLSIYFVRNDTPKALLHCD